MKDFYNFINCLYNIYYPDPKIKGKYKNVLLTFLDDTAIIMPKYIKIGKNNIANINLIKDRLVIILFYISKANLNKKYDSKIK